MDNKTWLWRKKSSEKTIVATNKFSISAKGICEETQKLPVWNEVGPVRPVRNLNEKLASVLLDSHAKDDLAIKNENSAGETVAAREKTQVETACLKEKSKEAPRQEVAATERVGDSDAALKQCKQQLISFEEEQEQKINDAVAKASSEHEKAIKQLEEKLMEMSQRLADVAIENTNLSKSLLVKEKMVEELHKRASQTAAEFNALMARLDSTEKENAFLKYEFHMLEKELEIRNEELEYNRQSADASYRQHLESVKKMTKLEAECQRLRVLMRKRLPSPAAFTKVKREVETELRRKPNPVRDLVLREAAEEKAPEIPAKNINFLIEQLRGMEEENKALKDIMAKKNAELQSSRIMFSRTASRLSQVESQLTELSGGYKSLELSKCSPISKELSPAASFDVGSDDGVSSSGSWANALISELEHFRGRKLKSQSECKAIEVSDMSLMDDFAEMEKLAIVSVETPSRGGNHPFLSEMEIVPLEQDPSSCCDKNQAIHSKNVAADKSFDWLQVVLNAIYKQQQFSKRSPSELLEDIKIALGYVGHPNANATDTAALSRLSPEFSTHSYITCKSLNSTLIGDAVNSNINTSVKEATKQGCQTKFSRSICKIIGLIEGLELTPSLKNQVTDSGLKMNRNSLSSATPADYFVRVFQWRSSELSDVLARFVCACKCLLNGKDGLEIFAEELSITLDWILSNYVSPKGDSSTRDKIKKHFGWNGTVNQSEVGRTLDLPPVEPGNIRMSKEQPPCVHSVPSLQYNKNNSLHKRFIDCDLREENNKIKDELSSVESAKNEMETKLREQEQKVEGLQLELENLKEYKGMIEDQIENQKLINEDLDTQLTVTKSKLNEILQKLSALEVELEDRSNCCEELEATCLELQLQLESVAKKESLNNGENEEGKQPQTGWEISAASVKLAECQETILNLGKQLKALASPREAALFDRIFPNINERTTIIRNNILNKRFSLRDQMLAEDSAKAIVLRSPSTAAEKPSSNPSDNNNALNSPNLPVSTPVGCPDSKQKAGNSDASSLAIVPSKKQGIGFLRRLLMRKKKPGSKKPQLKEKV